MESLFFLPRMEGNGKLLYDGKHFVWEFQNWTQLQAQQLQKELCIKLEFQTLNITQKSHFNLEMKPLQTHFKSNYGYNYVHFVKLRNEVF